MDDLARFMKAVSIYASGNDYEDIAYVDPNREDDSDDFLGRGEISELAVWVCWYQQRTGIIQQLSEKLQYFDELSAECIEGQLWINLNGDLHVLPPNMGDDHDTYIVISSMVWLLKDSYDFWLLKHLMDDNDSHAILVTTKAQSDELTSNYPGPASRWFIPLKPGHDYFCGIDVPYLDHEDHNPLFNAQREAVAPIIKRIHEQLAQRDAELREEHRHLEAWYTQATRDLETSNMSVSEFSRRSTELGQKNTRTLEAFTHKIAQLRQEIAQIVRQTGGDRTDVSDLPKN